MEKVEKQENKLACKQENLPEYEAPKIITYSEDELLAKLGPAQACSPFAGSVFGC